MHSGGQHLAVVGVSCRGYPYHYKRRMPLRLAGQHLTLQMLSVGTPVLRNAHCIIQTRKGSVCATALWLLPQEYLPCMVPVLLFDEIH